MIAAERADRDGINRCAAVEIAMTTSTNATAPAAPSPRNGASADELSQAAAPVVVSADASARVAARNSSSDHGTRLIAAGKVRQPIPGVTAATAPRRATRAGDRWCSGSVAQRRITPPSSTAARRSGELSGPVTAVDAERPISAVLMRRGIVRSSRRVKRQRMISQARCEETTARGNPSQSQLRNVKPSSPAARRS